MSEALRRGRLAVLAGPQITLAGRQMVTLSELRTETFLVSPRSLAPGAFEALKLMCREFGGFEANVAESAVATTVALGTDWRPIRDGTAIAVLAETTAHTLGADGIAVVPIPATAAVCDCPGLAARRARGRRPSVPGLRAALPRPARLDHRPRCGAANPRSRPKPHRRQQLDACMRHPHKGDI